MSRIRLSIRATLAVACILLLSAPPVLTQLATSSPDVPGRPEEVLAFPGPDPGKVTLQWTAPTTDGGSPIQSYRIYRGASPTDLSLRATATTPPFVDACAGHGLVWVFQVSAVNAAGEGPRSAIAEGASGAPPAVGDTVTRLGGRLPSARYGAAAVWTGTEALILGGSQGQQGSIVSYDPRLDCVRDVGEDLPSPQVYPSATWDGNYAYVFGGLGGALGTPLDDVVRYNPNTNQAESLQQSLQSPRSATSAVFAGGKHLLIGGMEGTVSGPEETDEVLDALSGAVHGSLPEARTHTAAVHAGPHALVFGGSLDWFEYDDIFRYDVATGEGTYAQSALPHEGIQAAGAVWDGQYAYVLGGIGLDSGPLDEVQRYDPARDGQPGAIQTLPQRLPDPVASAAWAWDGRHFYIFGGENDGAVLDAVTRYTPALPGERAPPQSLAATRGPGVGQISLSWQPPADATGLTGYRIYRGLTEFTTILHDVAPTPSFVDAGLAEGHGWCYRVAALFGSVESRISGAVCAKSPERASVPRALSATPGANVGEVNVSWQPPADTGGIPLQGYRLFRNGAPILDIQNRSFVDAGLPAWTAVTYTVRAVNAVGESAASNMATTYPASVPSAPQGFTAGGNGPGVARLEWNAPAVSGADALVGYRVYRTWPGYAERWADELGLTPRIWHDSDLPKGNFTYRLTAVNRFGESPSTPIHAVEIRVLPDRPLLAGRAVGVGQIRLEWDLADDGGSPILNFQVYRSLEADKVGDLVVTTDAGARAHTDLVVVPTNYYYSLVAKTGMGEVISFQKRVFLPPADCASLPTCIDGDQLCGSLDRVDYDGDLVPDCLDDDVDGDHLHNDLESDLLLDPRNRHSDRNPRVSTDRGDGLEDHHDPRPSHKDGLAVAVELVQLCINTEWDFVPLRGHLAPADPYLGPGASLLTTSADNPNLALGFDSLRRGNHYHNKFCIDKFAQESTDAIREVSILPRDLLTEWEWSDGPLNVPQVKIRASIVDHDTSDCPISDPDHDCVENVRGDDDLGYLTENALWGLGTIRWPSESSVSLGRLEAAPLAQEITVTSAGPGPMTLKVRAQTNMGGCDLVTSVLGKSYPPGGQDPTRIITKANFWNANDSLKALCSKVRADPGPLP